MSSHSLLSSGTQQHATDKVNPQGCNWVTSWLASFGHSTSFFTARGYAFECVEGRGRQTRNGKAVAGSVDGKHGTTANGVIDSPTAPLGGQEKGITVCDSDDGHLLWEACPRVMGTTMFGMRVTGYGRQKYGVECGWW